MHEQDSIREWTAQHERAEYLVAVCRDIEDGRMDVVIGCAALMVAGIDPDTAKLASTRAHRCGSAVETGLATASEPDAPQPETARDGINPNAVRLSTMALDGIPCAIVGPVGSAHEAVSCMGDLGWSYHTTGTLTKGDHSIRVHYQADTLRGPTYGAVWLAGATEKQTAEAIRCLRVEPRMAMGLGPVDEVPA